MIDVAEANADDAARMSLILTESLVAWNSQRPRSVQHVLDHYIEHPDSIRCSVARDGNGTILGFQSLKRASSGTPYDLPVGWGIIGTYVAGDAGRKGVGKALFASSRDAAKATDVTHIDATIGEQNKAGLAYYEAMGFRTYKTRPGAVCKAFRLV